MEASDRAYVAGLKMLARRELTEAQVRSRLDRRAFDPGAIDAAVARLRAERALDDQRTALACARTEAGLRHHGRARALRQLEAIGVPRGVARAAVDEVFGAIDEEALLQRALERRLRHGASLQDAAASRRLYRYLLAQGFDPSRVAAAIRSRARNPCHDD